MVQQTTSGNCAPLPVTYTSETQGGAGYLLLRAIRGSTAEKQGEKGKSRCDFAYSLRDHTMRNKYEGVFVYLSV